MEELTALIKPVSWKGEGGDKRGRKREKKRGKG